MPKSVHKSLRNDSLLRTLRVTNVQKKKRAKCLKQ